MPRKIKQKSTGRIIEIDDDGNVIVPKGSTEPGIRALTPADQFYNYAGRFIPGGLSAAGGFAGSVLGTPMVGGAIGTAVGSGLGKSLQAVAPSLFGELPGRNSMEDVIDVAKEVGVGALFDIGTKGLSMGFPSVRKEVGERIAGKLAGIFTPSEVDPTLLKPNPIGPQIDLTAAQQNSLGNWVAKTFAPQKYREVVKEQQKQVSKYFNPKSYPTEDLVKTAQTNAKNEAARLYGERSANYGTFNPFKAKNTKIVQRAEEVPDIHPFLGIPNRNADGSIKMKTIYHDIPVEGAIAPKQSFAFANDLGSEIDKILGPKDVNAANLGQGTGWRLQTLRNELDKIRRIQTHLDPVTKMPTKDPIVSYDDLHAIKMGIDDFTRENRDSQVKNILQSKLEALASAIGNDIDAGVKGWGSKAEKALEKAKKSHIAVIQKLRPDLAQDLIAAGKDPEITYMQIAREFMSDPQKARQFIAASDDKASARQIFFNNMANDAWNPVTGTYNTENALRFLHDNKEIAGEVLTPTQITNHNLFLQKASKIKEIPEGAGSTLNWAQGRATINLGVGLPLLGAGTGIGALYSGGLLLGPVAARKLSEKILLDPKISKIARGLLSASPRSVTAKKGTKALLGAMKFTQMIATAPNGRQVPVMPDENGNLIQLEQ